MCSNFGGFRYSPHGNRSEMTWLGGIFLGRFLGDETDYSVSPSLGMRRITPSLRACGTDPVFQHELYRSRRAGSSEGQCFRMLYEMWSRGLGEKEDLHLKIISLTSLCEMGSSLNGMVAGGGCGSQAGLVEWNGSGWGCGSQVGLVEWNGSGWGLW